MPLSTLSPFLFYYLLLLINYYKPPTLLGSESGTGNSRDQENVGYELRFIAAWLYYDCFL